MINECPSHLWRHPTRSAIDSLAKRFDLPNDEKMQDWEYEVADPDRVAEFIDAYKSGELSEDERFTIMETIIQSFEDQEKPLEENKEWQEVLRLIEINLDLHICTVWYWSLVEDEPKDKSEWWKVTPFIRPILARNCYKYTEQDVHSRIHSSLHEEYAADTEQ
ncbi:MAG: hypothetical protein AAGG51_20885 [Cyanobacteria bacterium P01_G01_bin.54]